MAKIVPKNATCWKCFIRSCSATASIKFKWFRIISKRSLTPSFISTYVFGILYIYWAQNAIIFLTLIFFNNTIGILVQLSDHWLYYPPHWPHSHYHAFISYSIIQMHISLIVLVIPPIGLPISDCPHLPPLA